MGNNRCQDNVCLTCYLTLYNFFGWLVLVGRHLFLPGKPWRPTVLPKADKQVSSSPCFVVFIACCNIYLLILHFCCCQDHVCCTCSTLQASLSCCCKLVTILWFHLSARPALAKIAPRSGAASLSCVRSWVEKLLMTDQSFEERFTWSPLRESLLFLVQELSPHFLSGTTAHLSKRLAINNWDCPWQKAQFMR